jgi:hypothetical protein
MSHCPDGCCCCCCISCCLPLRLDLCQADLQQLCSPDQCRELRSMQLQLRLLLQLAAARCLQHPLLLLRLRLLLLWWLPLVCRAPLPGSQTRAAAAPGS